MLRVVNPYNPLDVPAGKLRIAFNSPRDVRRYIGDGTVRARWSIIGYETIDNLEYLIMDYDYPTGYPQGLESMSTIFNTYYEDIKILGGDLTGRHPDFLMRNCTKLSTVAMVDTRNTASANGRSFNYCFDGCTKLTTIAPWPTSNITSWQCTFRNCINLQAIPAFDMSGTQNMYETFKNTYAVESGALSIYNQVSGLGVQHDPDVFTNCGLNTTTGLAELQQIPQSWGGRA